MKTKITNNGVRAVIDDRAMAEKLFESSITKLYAVDKLGVEYEIHEYSELLEFIMDNDYSIVTSIIRRNPVSEDNKIIAECLADMQEEEDTVRHKLNSERKKKDVLKKKTAVLVSRAESMSRRCLSAVRHAAGAEGCEPFLASNKDRPHRTTATIRDREHLVEVSAFADNSLALIVEGPPNLRAAFRMPESDWMVAEQALDKFFIRLYTYNTDMPFQKVLDSLNKDLGTYKR